MMAAYEGHFDIVEYLINVCRADTNLRDCNGKRAFDKAREPRIQYLLSSAAIERRLASTFSRSDGAQSFVTEEAAARARRSSTPKSTTPRMKVIKALKSRKRSHNDTTGHLSGEKMAAKDALMVAVQKHLNSLAAQIGL